MIFTDVCSIVFLRCHFPVHANFPPYSVWDSGASTVAKANGVLTSSRRRGQVD